MREQGIKEPERDRLVLGSTLVSCCIFPPLLCSSFPQAKWGALRLVRGLESESCTACGASAISRSGCLRVGLMFYILSRGKGCMSVPLYQMRPSLETPLRLAQLGHPPGHWYSNRGSLHGGLPRPSQGGWRGGNSRVKVLWGVQRSPQGTLGRNTIG